MVGEMVKKQGRARLHISCNYSCTLYFLVNILLIKGPSRFSLLEAKLWHNKAKTKNIKAAKMVKLIKTCDQYPCRFNFGNFFKSLILSNVFASNPNHKFETFLQRPCWYTSMKIVSKPSWFSPYLVHMPICSSLMRLGQKKQTLVVPGFFVYYHIKGLLIISNFLRKDQVIVSNQCQNLVDKLIRECFSQSLDSRLTYDLNRN